MSVMTTANEVALMTVRRGMGEDALRAFTRAEGCDCAATITLHQACPVVTHQAGCNWQGPRAYNPEAWTN